MNSFLLSLGVVLVRALRLGVVLVVLLTGEARATFVPATFCVEYENLSYNDLSTGDYFTSTTQPARGALLRFDPAVGGTFGVYLDAGGSTPGCKTLLVDDAATYAVLLVREASIAGNFVEVTTASGSEYVLTLKTGFTPTALGTYDNGDWNTVWSETIQILAVASWALHHRDGGLSGETFTYIPTPTGGTYYSATDGKIYLNTNADHEQEKHTIAHELGHAIGDAANNWQGNNQDYQADLNACVSNYSNGTGDHKMNSKEYNSAAAVEGFAHFYAAVVFNANTGFGADCDVKKRNPTDWDRDLDINGPEDVLVFSCEGDVEYFDGSQWVQVADNLDYLGDYCVGSGQTNNRGTEYDWLRMFWDLYTDKGVGFPDIAEIWNEANPHSWNDTGDNTGSAYPSSRMSSAANTVGGTSLQTDYNSAASANGTDR